MGISKLTVSRESGSFQPIAAIYDDVYKSRLWFPLRPSICDDKNKERSF